MTETYPRNVVTSQIRINLQRRSGKTWSVTGGRGTAWGWLLITAPKARLVGGSLSEEDRRELSELLDQEVHHQGISIPSGSDFYREYLDRAAGREPSVVGVPSWD